MGGTPNASGDPLAFPHSVPRPTSYRPGPGRPAAGMFVAGDVGGFVGKRGGIVVLVPSAPSRAPCGDSFAAGLPVTWLGPRTGLLDRNSRWYSYWSDTDVVLVEVIASAHDRRLVSDVLVVCSP